MNIDIDEIKPYRDAVEQEALVRDVAFLGLNETVLGFEVRPMTLRHLLWLGMVESPFVRSLKLELAEAHLHVAAFVRVVSFRNPAKVGWLQDFAFRRRYRRWASKTSVIESVVAVREYVAEAVQDAPGGSGGGKAYFSAAASIANYVMERGKEPFAAAVSAAMDVPLKVSFQIMRANRMWHDPKAIMFNPSDDVLARELTALEKEGRN